MGFGALSGSGRGPQRPEFERLAGYLDLLANPARLELLHLLRQPMTANEIRLEPSEATPGLRGERKMTEQAVRKHLGKLKEAGLATSRRVRRNGLPVEEHIVNHAMLFVIMEELRLVSRIDAPASVGPAKTLTGGLETRPAPPPGPRLRLLQGPREGETIRLTSANRTPGRGWVVGRKPGLAASLDYDLFMSQEHAEVLMVGDRFELLDLRTNKNGTLLNWSPLPKGGSAPLTSGDVLGVGRTSLLFRVP